MTLEVDARVERDHFAVEAAFRAEEGKTVALLGPNGAGKSTVVSCLTGILPPVQGRVSLDGRTLDDPSARLHVPPEERPIGVVFQGGLLLPHLSALENVAFPLRARGMGKKETRESAGRLLERLGFPSSRAAARPSDLSGGELQRVALARALIRGPRLLLMDEPTSSLDVRARAEVRPVIGSVLAGFSGIRVLVTHDPVEAMSLAEHVLVMEEGRITQSAAPHELRDSPRTPYVAELVGVNLFSGRLEPEGGGAGRLVTGDGSVVVAWPAGVDGTADGVLGVLRPADVVLHVSRPEGGSARNVLRGRIVGISVEGERARIRVAAHPPVVAEVTLGSIPRLGLAEGNDVWASFKAVEVALRFPDRP